MLRHPNPNRRLSDLRGRSTKQQDDGTGPRVGHRRGIADRVPLPVDEHPRGLPGAAVVEAAPEDEVDLPVVVQVVAPCFAEGDQDAVVALDDRRYTVGRVPVSLGLEQRLVSVVRRRT